MKIDQWHKEKSPKKEKEKKEKEKCPSAETRMMGLGVKMAPILVVQIFMNTNSFSGDFHWFPDFNKSKAKSYL